MLQKCKFNLHALNETENCIYISFARKIAYVPASKLLPRLRLEL